MSWLVFMRHGQSMGNAWTPAYNDDRTNFLTLEGVEQCRKAAETLRGLNIDFDHIHVSNMTRALQTATLVAQHMQNWHRTYEINPLLNERSDQHRPAVHGDNWEAHESEQQHRIRINRWLDQHEQLFGDGDRLIVSHGITMTVMFQRLFPDLVVPAYPAPFENAVPYCFRVHSGGVMELVSGGRATKKEMTDAA